MLMELELFKPVRFIPLCLIFGASVGLNING